MKGQTDSKHILILDGETRSALATVRSLGQAGYFCIIASEIPNCLASNSKYAAGNLLSPKKNLGASTLCTWLLEIITKAKIDYIIPTSEFTLNAIYSNTELANFLEKLPFPSEQSFKLSLDKFKLIDLASNQGINCPKSILVTEDFLNNPKQVSEIFNKLGTKIVLKPRWSVQILNSKPEKPPIRYAENESELATFLQSDLPRNFSYLAQEYISGEGAGFFLMLRDGKVTGSFAHQRILEKPPEGGVSVLSESTHAPIEIFNKVEALLKSLSWNGVAMVEFKMVTPNKYYLIEINPRFWGSLQLAIDCGVNFPKLLLINSTDQHNWNSFPAGRRLRWELGLLDHALIQIKRNGLAYFFNIFTKNSLHLFKSNTKNEILDTGDLNPFYSEAKDYISLILKTK